MKTQDVRIVGGGFSADDSLVALVLLIVLWWASCEVVYEVRKIRKHLTDPPAVEAVEEVLE